MFCQEKLFDKIRQIATDAIIPVTSAISAANKTYLIFFIFTDIMALIKYFKKDSKIIVNYKKMLIYWMIGILGVIWYAILKEHSYQHYFFTYRNFLYISIAFLLGIYNGIERGKNEKINKERENL